MNADDGHTLRQLTPLQVRDVEQQNEWVNTQLDHFIEVIGRHHAEPACPIFCFGQHFIDDMNLLLMHIDQSGVISLLYAACARLAGLDTH